MKNINFTLLGQYKIIQTNIILLFLLISSCSITLKAQNGEINHLASIQYNVNKSVSYSIPNNSVITDLKDFDIASIRPFQENSKVHVSLLSDGSLKTEIIYPEGVGGLDPWITKHYKSIFSKNNMVYYDKNNNVLFQKNISNNNNVFPTSAEFINQFGYSTPITVPTSNELNTLIQHGMTVQTNQDGSYTVLMEDRNMIFNPIKKTVETQFIKDGIVDFIITERYETLPNYKTILVSKITKTYLPTVNELIKIEKKVEEIYYNHNINGLNLATNAQKSNRANNELNVEKSINQYEPISATLSTLSVSPNPSNGELTVIFSSNNQYEIQILNFEGKLLKTEVGEGNIQKMNLSSLDKGIYLLRTVTNGIVQYQKIVLQ